MPLPADYPERVYAGVLGKLIGVYLGRPFEQWSHERIQAELGDITYYVHEKRGMPLIVTDDDISGTFTFLRALPDYGNSLDLTPAQIGQTWLNYIIEERTILWWGGMGNSTEHTAYLRLKNGIPAPESGSIARNGQVVAEQIGAQIFVDGWALVSPGDPERAVDLARRAGSVSHDGESIYGAQVIAAMEALAFVEDDLNKLIDTAVTFIPRDSLLYRMIGDVREWHSEFRDWRDARTQIAATYGYDQYGGNCHIIPNHALIIHSLLYGDDDFQKAMMIVNTSGWDTDCNAGNVGCILGIKNGLAGLETGPDWRGPVADRLYLSTADGGRAISDAVAETYQVVNIGRALAGESPLVPKIGARFHFEFPGAVQGFMPENSIETQDVVQVENVEGYSQSGARSLAIRYQHLAAGRAARVSTPTFIPPEAINMVGYELFASPTLYPGQTVRARITADPSNAESVKCRLYIQVYGANDKLEYVYGSEISLAPGNHHVFEWLIDDRGGSPIASIGIEATSIQRTSGTIYLDYLTWDGTPNMTLRRPAHESTMWRRAWVRGVDHYDHYWPEAFRIIQDHGTGLLMHGGRDWTDYRVSATLVPHMATAWGIGARVQGMVRYYALQFVYPGKAQLIKALDGEQVLAEMDFPWTLGNSYQLALQVEGTHLIAWINGELVFDVDDTDRPLDGGGVAFICTEGRMATDAVTISPILK